MMLLCVTAVARIDVRTLLNCEWTRRAPLGSANYSKQAYWLKHGGKSIACVNVNVSVSLLLVMRLCCFELRHKSIITCTAEPMHMHL